MGVTLVPGGGVRDTFLELGVMLEGVNGNVDRVIGVSVIGVDGGVFCVTGVTEVTEELLALVVDLIWLDGEVNGDPTEPGGIIVVLLNEVGIAVEPTDELDGEEAVPVNEGVFEPVGRIVVLLIEIDGFVEPADLVGCEETVLVKVEITFELELLDVPLLGPGPVCVLK